MTAAALLASSKAATAAAGSSSAAAAAAAAAAVSGGKGAAVTAAAAAAAAAGRIALRTACSYHVTVSHYAPAWTVSAVGSSRRLFGTAAALSSSSSSQAAATAATVARWKDCVSRLYARKVLLAAAAAASNRRRVLQLEEAAAVHSKPADWNDWRRADSTAEWLRELGGSRAGRWWSAACRVLSLAALAAPLTVMVPVSTVSDTVRDWTWRYALAAIEAAGPTFIKLAQWATTRQDLFSPEFCIYFGQLRDQTTGHAFRETVSILQQELGHGVVVVMPENEEEEETKTTIGDDNDKNKKQHSADAVAVAVAAAGPGGPVMQLEHEPIGSGCIAQVYRGKLLRAAGQYPAGTEIAVKVQHPGIFNKVCVDFYLLSKAAKWLEDLPVLNLRYLSLQDTVRQFRDIMLPQLDLLQEAANLNRFNRDFASDDQVSFPRPVSALTSTRVLTETFVTGTPILEYCAADRAVRKDLAYLGLNTTLKMIFLHDFLHGDLHPGNILVSEDVENSGRLHLHLLDCGLVVEMGPDQHVNVVKILGAFTRRNGRLAGQLMVDSGNDSQASAVDVELFCAGVERICEQDGEQNFVENVGDYIADICYLACRHAVKLEASFINAALAVEIMEGIAAALHPELTVTAVALPLVVKAEMMHRIPKLW